MTLKVGITGGIGSGKTFVAQIFEKLNIPVYYSDKQAKRLMNENKEIRNNLIQLLGKSCYNAEEQLDKKYLARKIFSNRELIGKVNRIVHPVVRMDFNLWTKVQNSKYVLQESAILFEIGADKFFDKMIIVTAAVDLRIRRVTQRDKVSKKAVMQRMQNQWKQEDKAKLADFVIRNNEQEMLIPQVIAIHEKLLKILDS